jgi:hypothetical protein
MTLPGWLVSPFADRPLTSDMIKFGFGGDYGADLAHEIRGASGVEHYGTLHLGLDLQIPGLPDGGRGAPVVAPFEGRIVRTSDAAGGPFGIWLESEKLNLRARLMHMDGLVVGIESGVLVKAGQQLGVLGDQGTQGFTHLHLSFERLSDGGRVNPALFFRLRDSSDPGTLAGRWQSDLPRMMRAATGRIDVRLIPDGDGRQALDRTPRPTLFRFGPVALPSESSQGSLWGAIGDLGVVQELRPSIPDNRVSPGEL